MESTSRDFLKHELNFSPALPTLFHGTAFRQNGNCTFWCKRRWVIHLTVQPVSEFMEQINW